MNSLGVSAWHDRSRSTIPDCKNVNGQEIFELQLQQAAARAATTVERMDPAENRSKQCEKRRPKGAVTSSATVGVVPATSWRLYWGRVNRYEAAQDEQSTIELEQFLRVIDLGNQEAAGALFDQVLEASDVAVSLSVCQSPSARSPLAASPDRSFHTICRSIPSQSSASPACIWRRRTSRRTFSWVEAAPLDLT